MSGGIQAAVVNIVLLLYIRDHLAEITDIIREPLHELAFLHGIPVRDRNIPTLVIGRIRLRIYDDKAVLLGDIRPSRISGKCLRRTGITMRGNHQRNRFLTGIAAGDICHPSPHPSINFFFIEEISGFPVIGKINGPCQAAARIADKALYL